jgi:hypothetical protein
LFHKSQSAMATSGGRALEKPGTAAQFADVHARGDQSVFWLSPGILVVATGAEDTRTRVLACLDVKILTMFAIETPAVCKDTK